jgi:hypothetical protein
MMKIRAIVFNWIIYASLPFGTNLLGIPKALFATGE